MWTAYVVLVIAAHGHPGADAHLHATADVACDGPVLVRRAQALTGEGRHAEARRELDRADACGLHAIELAVARARLALAEARPVEALAVLDGALAREPSADQALLTRSEALVELGRTAEAAEVQLAVARRSERPAPELWRSAASLLADTDPRRAVTVLDEGLASCGPIASLQRQAARLEAGWSLDDALARLGDDPEGLTVRGELMAAAGQHREARAAWTRALDVLASARNSAGRQARESDLRSRIQDLEG